MRVLFASALQLAWLQEGAFARASELVADEQDRLRRLASDNDTGARRAIPGREPLSQCAAQAGPETNSHRPRHRLFGSLARFGAAGSSQDAEEHQEAATIAEMSRIAAVEDPVLRHLLVGRCYHVLGREIAEGCRPAESQLVDFCVLGGQGRWGFNSKRAAPGLLEKPVGVRWRGVALRFSSYGAFPVDFRLESSCSGSSAGCSARGIA